MSIPVPNGSPRPESAVTRVLEAFLDSRGLDAFAVANDPELLARVLDSRDLHAQIAAVMEIENEQSNARHRAAAVSDLVIKDFLQGKSVS